LLDGARLLDGPGLLLGSDRMLAGIRLLGGARRRVGSGSSFRRAFKVRVSTPSNRAAAVGLPAFSTAISA